MGSFLIAAILIWAVAMGAWFLVSKYFKSSDVDRVKARLLETRRTRRKRRRAPPRRPSFTRPTTSANQFAQTLVGEYQPGSQDRRRCSNRPDITWTPGAFG